MGSVQALREDYNNRQIVKHKKRDAAVQAIFTGSAALATLASAYLSIKVFVTYGFWIPTLVIVAIVMVFAYVSASKD